MIEPINWTMGMMKSKYVKALRVDRAFAHRGYGSRQEFKANSKAG